MNYEEFLEMTTINNPLMDLLYIDYPDIYFKEDGVEVLTRYISEAKDGMTKQNILRRIWEFIKKLFKWIWKQVDKLIDFIKWLFSRSLR